MQDADQLARNRRVLVTSAGLGFVGFTLSMAFLPMYIQQLGVTEQKSIALWTGLCFGVTPLIAGAISPFWARLAVRYGNKIMVERAMLSFVVIMALTAQIHDVRLLFLLRFLQGIFGGYAGMVLSMVASSSSKEDLGRHIGTLQSVQTFSTAAGPLLGGLIGAAIGLRNTFYITSCVYLASLVYVHFGYRERRGESHDSAQKEEAAPVKDVFRIPGFLPVFFLVFAIQYIDRSFGPVIPMYVAQVHGYGRGAAVLAGLILTSGSLAVSIAAVWWGRQTLKKSAGALMVSTTIAGTLVSLAMAIPGNTTSLLVLRVILGLTAGGTMTLAFSWGGALIPTRIRTSSFTVLASASLYAVAVSPLISGLIMTLGVNLVFLANSIMYASTLGLLLALRRRAQSA